MKFSVITPCYNSEKYIHKTIESVIYQKGDFEIEYILIDGNSFDNTLKIIKRYKELVHNSFQCKCSGINLFYISEKDKGMYDALCKGFRLATGDIISYINSDDLYFPNAFQAVSEIFDDFPSVKWLTGINTVCNGNGQITNLTIPFKYSRKIIQKGGFGTVLPHIQQESTFWRKNILNDIDLNELSSYMFAGDFYLWKNFSLKNELYIIQSSIGIFRYHKMQLSNIHEIEYSNEFRILADKKNILDYIHMYLLKILWLLPGGLKKVKNKKYFYYNKENNNKRNWIISK